MGVHPVDRRLDRKRRARTRELRRGELRQASRFAPVAWLAHLLSPKGPR